MNILMMTNTYTPHVGGVARSVENFTEEYRKLGHRVVVVAPEFAGAPEVENGVVRVPAIQNFNSSDFSVRLPVLDMLALQLEEFEPDIVHSHHPFLLGDTALRIAASRGIPLVFTNHTMYERYTHYVPGDSSALKAFVTSLATGYANLCNHVIAPSESIENILKERGVETPISVIPTGIDVEKFAKGNGDDLRRRLGIGEGEFVVGHVGRLAHEKNLPFLGQAVGTFMWRHPESHFLVVGSGPAEEELRDFFRREGMGRRAHFIGVQSGRKLADAYEAMDVFVFASQTETQGLVLAEAMAAHVPVIGVDAPGVREVVRCGVNGLLIHVESIFAFASALEEFVALDGKARVAMKQQAYRTAEEFSNRHCAQKALDLYESIREKPGPYPDESTWLSAFRVIKMEWGHWQKIAEAAGTALLTLIVKDEV